MSFEHEGGELEHAMTSGKPFFSRPVGKVFVIWVVMTAVGLLISFYLPHHILPTLMASTGTDVFRTVVVFSVLAAPVAALVYAIAVYSLLAWRHKGDQDVPPEDGPPIHGNGPLTVLWLVVSSVLVVVLLVWGLAVLSAQQTTHPNTLHVDVTGQQWQWTFSYPGTGVQSTTLVLPVNRPVQFNVTSVDVTHGFWPVNMGIQVDANPKVVTVVRSTPDQLGGFQVRCSQICGLYHSFMYASGSVVTPAQFSQWLQAHGASTAVAIRTASAGS
jgi:cytochrome c oxidase subunit 2